MVRTVIPFHPRPRDADRFVADLAQEEQGGAPSSRPETREVETVWDALGGLDAADFDLAANDAGSPRLSRRAMLTGAGLAASGAVGGAFLWSRRAVVHETGIGERETLVLSDGSQVTLNTATRIEVRLDGGRREVRLDSGEAFFSVAHLADAAPFDVLSDGARIRVTGTRFNVRRHSDFTRVDLIEGGVAVGPASEATSRLILRPGQAVRLDKQGLPGSVVPARLEQIADWRQGRISFDGAALAEAVLEMNRYSRIRLVVVDPRLARTPVDGVFMAGDTAAFAGALQALYGTSIARDGDLWTLSP